MADGWGQGEPRAGQRALQSHGWDAAPCGSTEARPPEGGAQGLHQRGNQGSPRGLHPRVERLKGVHLWGGGGGNQGSPLGLHPRVRPWLPRGMNLGGETEAALRALPSGRPRLHSGPAPGGPPRRRSGPAPGGQPGRPSGPCRWGHRGSTPGPRPGGHRGAAQGLHPGGSRGAAGAPLRACTQGAGPARALQAPSPWARPRLSRGPSPLGRWEPELSSAPAASSSGPLTYPAGLVPRTTQLQTCGRARRANKSEAPRPATAPTPPATVQGRNDQGNQSPRRHAQSPGERCPWPVAPDAGPPCTPVDAAAPRRRGSPAAPRKLFGAHRRQPPTRTPRANATPAPPPLGRERCPRAHPWGAPTPSPPHPLTPSQATSATRPAGGLAPERGTQGAASARCHLPPHEPPALLSPCPGRPPSGPTPLASDPVGGWWEDRAGDGLTLSGS